MDKVEEKIRKQLAYEFDMDEGDFSSKENIFTLKDYDENFFYNDKTKANIISYKNKLLCRCEDVKLLNDLKEKYKTYPGQWFMDADNIYELMEILDKYGLKIRNIFPVFAPKFKKKLDNTENFYLLKDKDFEQYRSVDKYDFVFTYEKGEIGMAYKEGEKIIALASATEEARYFYDMGLEKYIFDKKYKSVATKLLIKLSNYILENKERIPLCSTQFTHGKSLNTMINAGYRLFFTNISIG